MKKAHQAEHASDRAADLIWGGQGIADFLGLPVSKFYHLNSLGAFGDAVARISHKTLVGSRSALAQLPQRAAAKVKDPIVTARVPAPHGL